MAVTLYFGIRLPGKPYERIAHKLEEDAYCTWKVENLKKFLRDDLLGKHSAPSGLELVYCGSVLEDSVEICKEGIKSGSTIHVFEKNEKRETSEPTVLTEDAIADASKAFRSVCFSNRPNNLFPKVVRPEVINKVLEKYPEFYSDPGAFAILRDAVLLEKMINSSQAKLIGDQYPILIHSAKFLAETMINVIKKNPIPSQRARTEDSSESSASENDSPQASPNHSNNSRISSNQLAAALLFAGNASLNSLSNIAQRSVDDEEMVTTSSTTPSSQTSSVSAVDPGTSSFLPIPANGQRYATELQTMRDMGLTEEHDNLQALILCNGNVEAAVNLVLGIGNFA